MRVALLICAIGLAACGTSAEPRPARSPVGQPSSEDSFLTLQRPSAARSAIDGASSGTALGSSNGCSTPNTFAVAPAATPAVSPLDAPIAERTALFGQ